jgi:hypothetical protein
MVFLSILAEELPLTLKKSKLDRYLPYFCSFIAHPAMDIRLFGILLPNFRKKTLQIGSESVGFSLFSITQGLSIGAMTALSAGFSWDRQPHFIRRAIPISSIVFICGYGK